MIERIKVICGPMWEKRARRQENKSLDRLPYPPPSLLAVLSHFSKLRNSPVVPQG